jgi:type 1 fimbria pilin
MAKFINFNIVGGYDLAAGAADASLDGDNLVAVDGILSVKAEAGASGEYNVVLQLTGGLSCRVTCSISAAAEDPSLDVPTASNYLAFMKKAVNRAITANPGGVKASVILPLDSDDVNAEYNPALKVYWKDILIS